MCVLNPSDETRSDVSIAPRFPMHSMREEKDSDV